MRKSLRQIIRKQPKCANCNTTCLDSGKYAFSDTLATATTVDVEYNYNDDFHDIANGDSNRSVQVKQDVADPGKSSEVPGPDILEKPRSRKKTTIFDALFKIFNKEWRVERELLSSTMKNKENLILCSECSMCLTDLYDSYSKFFKLAFETRRHSYLSSIVCQTWSGHIHPKYKNSLLDEAKKDAPTDGIRIESQKLKSYSKPSEVDKEAVVKLVKIEKDTSMPPLKRKRELSCVHEKPEADKSKTDDGVPEKVTDTLFTTSISEEFFPSEELECRSCEVNFSDIRAFQKHLRSKVHMQKFTSEDCVLGIVKSEPESDPDLEPIQEDIKIESKRKKVPKIFNPVRRHWPKRKKLLISYVCTEVDCAFESQMKNEYLDHLGSVHGKSDIGLVQIESDSYVCLICDSVYKSAEDLETHCGSKHVPYVRVRSHSCDDCGKKFVTKHDLKNHMVTHSLPRTFACDECPFVARRSQELDRHIKCVHRKEKHFFCSVCNKGYPLKWQLNDHQRIHSSRRSFPCSHTGCDKSFRTPQNLRQHLELHKGAKYICEICGQSYSRKAYLRLHMNGTHLMIPLPPSQKRERNPTIPKRLPRIKSDAKITKSKSGEPKAKISIQPRPPQQQYLSPTAQAQVQLLQENPEGNPSASAVDQKQEENMIIVESYNPQGISEFRVNQVDEEGTLHVEMALDQQTGETVLIGGGNTITSIEPNFTLSDQIICVPVGSLDMVQRYPITFATPGGGNTFYITTAPASIQQQGMDTQGAISVYPFSELISLQQQQHQQQ